MKTESGLSHHQLTEKEKYWARKKAGIKTPSAKHAKRGFITGRYTPNGLREGL